MKVLRTVCGILTILLFFVILFQSCLVGAGNTLTASGELSGTTGLITAILMLIAGITGIVGRKSKGAAITALIIYVIAGIIACTDGGSYSDLKIYGSISFIFAILFLISVIVDSKKRSKEINSNTTNVSEE